jgi:hypothetical protein
VLDVVSTSEGSKQIFLALGRHFADQGQLDLFVTQILNHCVVTASAAQASDQC